MAGPWFVDPQNGLTTNNGLSADSPWKLIPGQTGASAQTGYGVVAGDTINVKRGSTTTLRLAPPANDLVYRGYGDANNGITLRVPTRHPLFARSIRLDGFWAIDGRAIDADGAIGTGARTGVVMEDVKILGPQIGTRNAVSLASSTTAASGFTLRRFFISGAAGRGISANTTNVTLEYGRIEYTRDDNIGLNAWAANSYRAGSTDRLRYLELIEPNRASEGAPDDGASGDHLHLQPSDGKWDGSMLSEGIRCHKTTGAKQAVVAHATGAASLVSFKSWSVGGGGDCQFLVGHIKGTMEFDGIYAHDWALEALPLFRFAAADTSPPAWAMDTGSVLRIKNVIAHGATPAFYRTVHVESAHSFDGLIEINNNTVAGPNLGSSTLALFEFWSASDLNTFGPNFQLRLQNNAALVGGKPQVKIPTGTGGDSRYQIAGNRFDSGLFQIGATEYANLAAFQVAHSAATGNIDSDPMVSDEYAPLPGSPLLTSGADLGYLRDIRGYQSRRHVGAYGAARLRAR